MERPAVRRIGTLVTLVLLAVLAGACATPAGAPDVATERPGAATDMSSPGATPAMLAALASATAPAATGGSLTISAVGDISLARGIVDLMQRSGADYPFALVAPLVDGDIGFANLEGTLTDRGEPWPKGYNFRTPPRFAAGLRAGHFDVVTLANNHVMDYGAAGLADTIDTLDALGVRHVGAGPNALGARLPAIVDVRGLRVAFLGYAATPDEHGGFSIRQWAAGPDTPGVAIGSSAAIAADVVAARRVADFVIVALHAGDEFVRTPNATQRALADVAIAAGADAYIGAHAHVVQPIEMRGRQLVAWGLGNFIFHLDDVDRANIPEPRVSLILNLTLTKGQGVTSYRAIPVRLDDAQDRPRPATDAEAAVLRGLIGP